MSAVTFREARPLDSFKLAPKLRASDVRELEASGSGDPLDALNEGYRVSPECWVAVQNGKVIAMFGVAAIPGVPNWGAAWFLGSDEVDGLPVTVYRQGARYVRKMHEHFDVLCNMIDARNLPSLQWLRALGFVSEGRAENYKGSGLPFYCYVRRKHV